MDIEFQQRSDVGRELAVEVVHRFGEVHLKVTGASMIPSIWPGNVITVRHNDTNLQPGQIVLYRRKRELVAQRITCV